jgi:hypothetical protein
MHSTIRPARRRGHLSRHERQRLARAEAFSRRTPPILAVVPPAKLETRELELIDRLVRHDRTAVSSALLAVAGIGADGTVRSSVLARVSEATCWAQAEGAIGSSRAEQIARHVKLALGHRGPAAA